MPAQSDTIALVERVFAALGAGDVPALLALCHEDVAFDTETGERLVGHEAIRLHLAGRARHFREDWADIAIMTAAGYGRAAAEFTLRGTYLATRRGLPAADGQAYALRAGMFFEVDGGSITRISLHYPEPELARILARG